MFNLRKKALASAFFACIFTQPAMSETPVTTTSVFDSQKSADDPGCKNALASINNQAKERLNKIKAAQEQTTVKSDDFMGQLNNCIDQLGGSFKNPFGMPSNPLDGLFDKLCQKGLDIVTSQNPITKAVNGFSVSDPTGTFSYNPQIGLNKSGKFTKSKSVNKTDISGQVWNEIDKRTPDASTIWN